MSGSALALWLAVVCAAVGGWLSTLNIALRELSRAQLRELAQRRGRPERVAKLLEHPVLYAEAVSAPRAMCNLALPLAALLWAAGGVGENALLTWPVIAKGAGLALALFYVLGVVAPASLATHAGVRIVYACAPLLSILRTLFGPFVAVARALDTALRRILGVREVSDAEELERQLMHVAAEGEEEGALNETERDIIESVVELRDRTAQDVMTPRTEIEGIEATDDVQTILRFIESAGHSRIPVYEGDLDHIVGVLYAKDLLRYVGRDASDFRIRQAVREPLFVPETIGLVDLLRLLQRKKVHMAIVLDEYGGTAGLVTFEDVLEELVGEIHDEYEPTDEAEPEATIDRDARSAVVDARMRLHEANEALEAIELALPDSGEYETVGGFVVTALGRIPAAGETFRVDGVVVSVLEAEPTRVTKVRVAAASQEELAGDEEPGRVVELPAASPATGED